MHNVLTYVTANAKLKVVIVYAMKTFGGMEAELHVFLTWALEEVSGG